MAYWDKRNTRKIARIEASLYDIEKRYQGVDSPTDYTYTCLKCERATYTHCEAKGATPFFLECPQCGGRAISSGSGAGDPPTHIWHRPNAVQASKLPPDVLEHVLRGGLLLRPADSTGGAQ